MRFLRLILACVLLLCVANSANAQMATLSKDLSDRRSSIPHDPTMQAAIKASGVEDIVVLTDGTRETFRGFARVQLDALTGRTAIHGQLPEYTVLSMIYQPDAWVDAKILPLEHPQLSIVLGTGEKWVSPRFVRENKGLDSLGETWIEYGNLQREYTRARDEFYAAEQAITLGGSDIARNSLAQGMLTRERLDKLVDDPAARTEAKNNVARLKGELDVARPFAEAAVKLVDRVKLFGELPTKLHLVPDPENPDGDWLSPANAPADKLEYLWVAAGMRLEQAFFDAFASGKGDKLATAVRDFTKVADTIPGYPSPTKRSVKNLWYRANPFQIAAWFYLFAAMTFGVATFFESARGLRIMRVLLIVGCITHTAAVLARLYITGHMPVSNMYESVTFVSWAAMMIALVIEFRRGGGVIGFGAALLGFLALIATSFLPLQEVRIHPLRAVLRSYWLNIHVTVMLLSYGAFALAAFFASCHLVKSFAKRDPLFGKTPLMPAAELEEFAYRLVQVGWPLLTLGIALGAVWAETAWGRYWGWDPKETWAFITWVVYTIYLHTRMVIGWRDRLSSGMCVIGFLMVLLTWFGVSYLPWFAGGLHSYASPT